MFKGRMNRNDAGSTEVVQNTLSLIEAQGFRLAEGLSDRTRPAIDELRQEEMHYKTLLLQSSTSKWTFRRFLLATTLAGNFCRILG